MPGTVEVALGAAPASLSLLPGKTTAGYAFNGAYPGPTLDLTEGDHVIVRFKNDLPEPTNVRWHGLPVPPASDGLPDDLVPPGGSRTYEFDVPLGTAGTYWYHPHPHGETASQITKGLVGAIRVRAKQGPLEGFAEHLVVLTDNKFDRDGQIAALTNMDRADGREGDVVFVNGRLHPRLPIEPGEVRRFRFVNASASRYYLLHVPGHAMFHVGTDGGLFGAPVERYVVPLAPAERAEVLLKATGGPQDEVTVESLAFDRGAMHVGVVDPDRLAATDRAEASEHAAFPLFELAYGDGAPKAPPALPAVLRKVPALATTGATPRTLTFTENMLTLDFKINGAAYDHGRVDIRSRVGATEVWTLVNQAEMDHPFHLHGFQFQVLERGGVPEPFPAWKDTVNIPRGERVSIAVKFDGPPGKRVYHCHILNHEDLGMMGTLLLEGPQGGEPLLRM